MWSPQQIAQCQNTLTDEMTHADTGVPVANCITSGQEILADNRPPATNDVLLTACGIITLVGDMSRVVSSSNRRVKQTANIINEAQCMYSSSNSEVVYVDDSDYIPSDCSFVSDSDACSTGRYVEIPLLQNTTHVLDTSETVTLPNRKRNQTNEPCSTMPKKKHTQQSDQQSAMGEHEDIDQTETTSPTYIGMKRKVRYEIIT